MCAVPVARVVAGFLMAVEIGEVFVHRVGDGDGAVLAVGAPRALDHRFSCRVLRLPEIEDRGAIGVRHVVGNADLLHFVGLLADVVARDPRARLPSAQPAVAEVEAALDGAVVGLPPDLEPTPRVSAIERLVVNPACHCCSPLLDTLLRVPSYVQYTWWNDRKRLGTRTCGNAVGHSRR